MAAASPKKKKTTRAPKKKKSPNGANLEHLQSVRDASKAQYGRSANTRKAYNGYLKRGRKWLSDVVKDRRANPAKYANDGIDTDLFSKAFHGKPNRYSAKALECLLVSNCFENGLKHQTGDGYHGAFNEYWRNIDGHSGEYSVDKETGTVQGNPGQCYEVKILLKTIQSRDRAGGAAATRDHAEAMTIEELEAIMTASKSICSDEVIEMATRGELDAKHLKLVMEHAMIRAFLTTGFVLWTRNFELCKLKRSDINWNCRSPHPPYTHFFTIFLENRKGWQNKSDYDCSRESNTYNMYSSTSNPKVLDVYDVLPRWVRLLESVLGRFLKDDDLIFPAISTNGQPQTLIQMTQNAISEKINKFASAAGLVRMFTTHSPRRGGAQYRFMWAPIGQRWSLRKVRWWGGWAEGENVETLMKYLMDSLSSYEENYSDALDPCRADRADHFMGDQLALAPVTNETLREYTKQLGGVLSSAIMTAQTWHTSANPNLSSALWNPQLFRTDIAVPAPAIMSATSGLGHLQALSARRDLEISSNLHAGSQHHQNPSPLTAQQLNMPSSSLSAESTSFHGSAITTFTSSFRATLPSNVSSLHAASDNDVPSSRLAIIPPLPRGRGSGAWKTAVSQWHNVDERTGFALKDWPKHWYKGPMAVKTGSKWHQRRLIAREYKRAGSDDAEFTRRYPEAEKTITELLQAIRRKHNATRSSKNGSPEARRAQQASSTPSDSNSDSDSANSDSD